MFPCPGRSLSVDKRVGIGLDVDVEAFGPRSELDHGKVFAAVADFVEADYTLDLDPLASLNVTNGFRGQNADLDRDRVSAAAGDPHPHQRELLVVFSRVK